VAVSGPPYRFNVSIDILRQHVERDVAAEYDRVVEGAQIVSLAKRGLGSRSLTDDFLVADFIAARLAGP
jgi:elongation factor P hydroxylase